MLVLHDFHKESSDAPLPLIVKVASCNVFVSEASTLALPLAERPTYRSMMGNKLN